MKLLLPLLYCFLSLASPCVAAEVPALVSHVNDYAALMKPALLCTAEGGTLICCNNAAP